MLHCRAILLHIFQILTQQEQCMRAFEKDLKDLQAQMKDQVGPIFWTVVFLMCSLVVRAQNTGLYLKVSENNRFLIKEDGSPFFWMGDTGWELFHKLDLEEIEYYLMNRAGKGYNVIQAVILGECDGLTKPTPEGYLPLQDNDPRQPDEDYFSKIDSVVKMAAERGLYMAMLPTWGAHAEDRYHPLFDNLSIFTPTNAFEYGKFLGRRYKDHWNVIWIVGGDRQPIGNEELWTQMIKGIREGSEERHLVSYHINGAHSITEFPEIAHQLDFYMLQSGHGNLVTPNYEMVAKDYAIQPTKPVIDAEPVYEDIPIAFSAVNGYTTDYEPRRAMYWSVFAGGFGTTYGNNSVWQMNRPEYKPVLDPIHTWDVALDAPGSFQVGHLKALMHSRPFLNRVPDHSLIPGDNFAQADYKIATHDATPGQNDATYIMAYFPIVRHMKIRTDIMSADQLRAWYFDPRTGNAYLIDEFENTGEFGPPWKLRIRPQMGGKDWVIVIDDASKNYPPPGTRL